ncbi:MAG: chromosomal replication initiator protein DnaA [Defluviitaleaceae bacterium]|nr:chromosomal replication initiator protein DnaA [Defluviitaleaceae bacterium]MCL2263362.1 chromosomal replication initiator protein DnaA [Defluviitaleaceae bacterium]
MDINYIWQETCRLMSKSISEVVFDTMIKPLEPVSYENGVFTVTAKSFFFKTSASRHIREMTRYVRSLTNEDVEVHIISPEDSADPANSQRLSDYNKTGLRPRYTFDTFVPGKCNELAYAGARAVADTPGQTEEYNPLFLYGGVGLGKTHLVHAIGNHIYDNCPNLKVLYVPSATFTNEFITSIREKTTPSFRKKYRGVDVLLIDDVQFLEGKEETQEEMFHTYNYMKDSGRQIVFTSDVPPNELKTLEVRLTSRFASGLIADVSIPDYETRSAILDKKLDFENIEIPAQIKEFILKNIISNVRDMEGAINKITAYTRLTDKKLTLDMAQIALKDLLVGKEKPVVTMEYIRQTVADHFKLSVDDLNSRKRTQTIVLPRQIAMYLCRKILDTPLPAVGKFFGGRDHTTVIHSCNKITAELEFDEKMRLTVEELEIHINGE